MEIPTQRFTAYLTPLLQSIAGVQYVGLSDGARIDRLLAESVSRPIYPCAFMIRPKYAGTDTKSGILWHRFHAIIYIFAQGSTSDYESQDAAYDTSERIATEALQKVFQDSLVYKCLFDFNDFQAEPIEYQTGVDATYGYEVKCVIGLPVNDLYHV